MACHAGPVLLIGDEPGPWRKIFDSVGVPVTQATALTPAAIRSQMEAGALIIVEGESEFAKQLGIRPGVKRIPVRSAIDIHNPRLSIIWERAIDIPQFSLPADAKVFTRERWSSAPLVAGLKRGAGALLWLAARPGPNGYERFPYLLQALGDLGLQYPVRSNRLWAFLDSSYRMRADIDYLADRWVRTGINGLHVAAWHFNEKDPTRDEWLRRLIDACHRRGILVYAWFELPHVSEQFWNDHPEWREKTALLQDAHLDWRKLMNLANADCARAVQAAVTDLVGRFDWDGVNLAELYFESLEGASNPARFTPMNKEVREEFRALTDTDPVKLLEATAPADIRNAFLEYRAQLVRRLQGEWLRLAESLRRGRPHLDLVLTHVDDRFDTRMRELIGADAAQTLPLLRQYDFTFLIEDPATVWHLGPERYREIARRYQPLTPRQDRLAIDLNIVERYQDVYPTRQQTGVELMQLVHTASVAFPRVALYFETSILKPDLDLLPAAAAAVTRFERAGERIVIETARGAGVQWKGPVSVNGRIWPVTDGEVVWVPAGVHAIAPAEVLPAVRIERLNADLRTATAGPAGSEFSYRASSRAFAILNRRPELVEIDGERVSPEWLGEKTLVLPRGEHVVVLR
jgi:hypothetical protein